MGAGSKSDPSRIQIADISETFEDPLARAVRTRLRLEGIMSGIPVVYSTENPPPSARLIPLPEEEYLKGNVSELSSLEKFRVRILPVLGPIPSMFGQAAASYIICLIAGYTLETIPISNRPKIFEKLQKQLSSSEFNLTGNNKIPFSERDMSYHFEEVHKSRSCVPPFTSPTKPILLRWDKSRPLDWDNIVCFERDEGMRHERECLKGDRNPEEYWGEEVTKVVKRRMAEERSIRDHWT